MSNRRANAHSQSTWRGRGRGRGDASRGQRGNLRGRGSARDDGPANDVSKRATAAGQSVQYLPSISRSGGQGGHGDTLKQKSIQDEYWESIQTKIADHWKKEHQMKDSLRKENEHNLLLHLRKLREGILSSKREDDLALTVYETSFYLAIVFESSIQTAASQSHLIQLFQTLKRPSDFSSSSSLHRKATAFLVTSSLLTLSESYPSQTSYYRNLEAIGNLPQSPNDRVDIDCLAWINALRSSLNSRNYVQSQHLTDSRRVNSILDQLPSPEGSNDGSPALDELLRKVVFKLVDSLREKLRESAWQVMRAAYRELTTSTANEADRANSAWVGRALFFHANAADLESNRTSISALEIWTKQKVNEGELVEKTGAQSRWLICRNKK